jgi:hypothetical protein
MGVGQKFKASRGGQKPQMMMGSEDISIEMGQGYKKAGMYEFAARFGELARRVELPHWLSEQRAEMGAVAFKQALEAGALKPPAQFVAESAGHIWLSPSPEHGWAGSAVGLDEEVFGLVRREGSKIALIRFVGYAPGYELSFQWRIKAQRFVELAQRVQTSEKFMPQWMVPVSELSIFVAR